MQANSPLQPPSGAKTAAAMPDKTVAEQSPSTPNTPQPPNTNKAFFRAKIGSIEFNSLNGAILSGSYVWLSTDRFSSARIVLDDPDGSILEQVASQSDVEVELGYVAGEKRNKFVGKIMRYGRKGSSATIVMAADPSTQMQSQVGATNVAVGDRPSQAQEQTIQDTPPENLQLSSSPGLNEAMRMLDNASATASGNQPVFTATEQFSVQSSNLRFASNTRFATSNQGTASTQQSELQAAATQAVQQGDVVVTRGNTVRQVQPGRGDPSDLVLDYQGDRAAFLGYPKPEILKRTPLQLMSGYAALSVTGYSINDKAMVGATVVVPGDAAPHPTGNIAVPEWGNVTLSESIVPGSLYTWNDATLNGTRVPQSREIMQRIALIAQVLDQLSQQYNSNRKFRINSWYRPPEVNRRVGGASNSRHLYGDAVDFSSSNMAQIHQALQGAYDGGLAIKHGSFVHVDRGSRRRWTY